MILDLKQSAIYSAHIQACMEDNTLSFVDSNMYQHSNISRHQIQTCLSIRFLFHQLQYLLSQKTLLHLYINKYNSYILTHYYIDASILLIYPSYPEFLKQYDI